MTLLLDIPPGPTRGDGILLIVIVAVAVALIFLAAVAAVAIFYFVRRRKQHPAVGAASEPQFTPTTRPADRRP